MEQDISKLTKKELTDIMDALSKNYSEIYEKRAVKADVSSIEYKIAMAEYNALSAKYKELEAEWNKRVAS